MIELLTGVLGLITLIVTYLWEKEKSKLDKAREILHKARAQRAKDEYYGQVRDTKEMEKRSDELLSDLSAIFSVRDKKSNPSD